MFQIIPDVCDFYKALKERIFKAEIIDKICQQKII